MAVTEIFEDDTSRRCECSRSGCVCDDVAVVVLTGDRAVCGCCFADCPDVHQVSG